MVRVAGGVLNETGGLSDEGAEGGRCQGAIPQDQGLWHDVRSTVEAANAFDDSFDPAFIDNAAGVEWDQYREGATGLAAGAEATFSIINRTQVPSSLQINPANQTLTQGQTAVINVASFDTANQPYAGKAVRYSIGGANAQAGSVILNSEGKAQIAYVGHNAGIDTIQMFVDLAGNGVQGGTDPAGTAAVTFAPAPPTPNSTYTIKSIHANSNGTITIVFVPTQNGSASVEVTVPTGTIAKHVKCKKGETKIKGKCRPKNTNIGKTSGTGVANVPLTLTVHLSGKARSKLKKGKSLHVLATLTYKSALGGTPTVQTYRITVPGKRKHHHGKHK